MSKGNKVRSSSLPKPTTPVTRKDFLPDGPVAEAAKLQDPVAEEAVSHLPVEEVTPVEETEVVAVEEMAPEQIPEPVVSEVVPMAENAPEVAPKATVSQPVPASPASNKAHRMAMGLLQEPIKAVKVLRKVQPHDFNGQKAESWVIFTPDHKMVKATTYDGNVGKKFNLGDHNTYPVPAENTKDFRHATKGYDPVEDASQLPMFIALSE